MEALERISLADATDLVVSALSANGLSRETASSVACALVAAEAQGQAGHGFSRFDDYLAQLRSGKINPNAIVTSTCPRPATVVIDADFGFAYPALDEAVHMGASLAKTYGTAVMAVTNSHHCGALSIQVERLAEKGLVAFMFANAPKAIAPWGGKEALFGTNPIAFAAPRLGQAPLVIDLSLSKVARGKIMNAKKTGQAIPEGWALDKDGQPTTDPEAALGGTMLPIADAKGTSLALMVEILAAVVTSAALSCEASSFFAAEGPPPRVGQFLMAIDAPALSDSFADRLEHLLSMIEASDGARLPGTRRLDSLAKAEENGLLVQPRYLATVRAAAQPALV